MGFDTRIYTAGGSLAVTVPADFCRNCLTPDPYLHSHPKYELHYILRGSGVLVSGTQTLPFAQGQLLLLPPDWMHMVRCADGAYESVTFLFSPDRGTLTGPLARLLGTQPRLLADSFGARERLLRIREELICKNTAYAEAVQGELTALLAALARALGDTEPVQPHQGEEDRPERIEHYLIANRFSPDCSCEALARELYLSQRQVQRLCVQYFHATFRQLLLRARMEAARERLRSTDVSVTELAAQLGYASTASFSAAYKRYYGYAPTRREVDS